MFRIRQIFDDALPGDREVMRQVQTILRSQFALMPEREVASLPDKLRDPIKHRFRAMLFVADDFRSRVKGFAFISHAPDLRFVYLDYLASATRLTSAGIGGALYERVRLEAQLLGAVGVFLECSPDEPRICHDAEMVKQNIARLRFYERYGARPIVNTRYETPVRPDGDCPPYLVFDNLGRSDALRRDHARQIARAILERRYAEICPPEYIQMVVESFQDDPVQIREPRYVRNQSPEIPIPGLVPVRTGLGADGKPNIPSEWLIPLVVNDRHELHHVRERGYVEAPVRVRSILEGLEPTGLFNRMPPREFPESHIKAVHEGDYVEYLKRVCAVVPPGQSVYPYVFPIRNHARAPKDLAVQAGYYCIDTFTPLNSNAYIAAKRSVDCTLTAARSLLEGARHAYALVRPPGHHAERRAFGGFCYFNSAAVAAQFLLAHGSVAILDLDYHHGNGQQDIFYERADVLTISIHGHPSFAYPYFTGFADEVGQGAGAGYNLNIPLPERVDGSRYQQALNVAFRKLKAFAPRFLIVALGFDAARGDPTGTWSLRALDFQQNGRRTGELRLPTLIVQEGGYRTRSLGANARAYFTGLIEGAYGQQATRT